MHSSSYLSLWVVNMKLWCRTHSHLHRRGQMEVLLGSGWTGMEYRVVMAVRVIKISLQNLCRDIETSLFN